MNNTKWNELFRAYYENELANGKSAAVFYRTKATNGYVSFWECMWEHFGSEFAWWKDLE